MEDAVWIGCLWGGIRMSNYVTLEISSPDQKARCDLCYAVADARYVKLNPHTRERYVTHKCFVCERITREEE